ncbi:recombinase family protein [Salmonella enterica subsp. enterica]|nr:recombinase family protein [Salmonella enterica subsp. enterica serovar Javiana]EDW0165187.1 recombinase family protein [Salmonella enterica subsp. enterica serovar Javiana]
MNTASKVQTHHLTRGAYLYIRQSSMRQIVENGESTRRQYALRGRAIALGWREEQIIVIDNDQGESGASAVWREGFQRLVSDVGLGRAGIVMGLEVSRLARNNADWQRLLEICALADTLILDEDGIYDPASFNDRLLLGLKGTMSEAELHVIKARLRGGILTKARRGEFRCALPTGFVYDAGGNVVLDPDIQVRETLHHFFDTFTRVGSVSQTVKVFHKEGILFPSRLHNSETLFRPLTVSTARRTLTNPRYAGAYVYGRRQYRRNYEGETVIHQREMNDWLACIPDAHPGYISWKTHQGNLGILRENGHAYQATRASHPREGAALLQGRAVCGHCGRHLRVRYATRRGRQKIWYVCDRAQQYQADPHCQSIAGGPVDEAVSLLIAEQMTPLSVELTLSVRREIEKRSEEADKLRCCAIERARTQADLAQRRFMQVDPDNRLVADTLESEWNEKLRILADAREERERAVRHDKLVVDKAVHERLIAMTEDFGKLWRGPEIPHRERKRLMALIVEDVTLVKMPAQGITRIHVRFKGGRLKTIDAINPKSQAQKIKTPRAVIEQIDRLLDTYLYEEIAGILNQQGYRPGSAVCQGKDDFGFTALRVAYLANRYKLRSRYDRLRGRGMLTKTEIARRLNIHEQTVVRWVEHGLIKSYPYNKQCSLYELPAPEQLPSKHSSRWDKLADRHNSVSQSSNFRKHSEIKDTDVV